MKNRFRRYLLSVIPAALIGLMSVSVPGQTLGGYVLDDGEGFNGEAPGLLPEEAPDAAFSGNGGRLWQDGLTEELLLPEVKIPGQDGSPGEVLISNADDPETESLLTESAEPELLSEEPPSAGYDPSDSDGYHYWIDTWTDDQTGICPGEDVFMVCRLHHWITENGRKRDIGESMSVKWTLAGADEQGDNGNFYITHGAYDDWDGPTVWLCARGTTALGALATVYADVYDVDSEGNTFKVGRTSYSLRTTDLDCRLTGGGGLDEYMGFGDYYFSESLTGVILTNRYYTGFYENADVTGQSVWWTYDPDQISIKDQEGNEAGTNTYPASEYFTLRRKTEDYIGMIFHLSGECGGKVYSLSKKVWTYPRYIDLWYENLNAGDHAELSEDEETSFRVNTDNEEEHNGSLSYEIRWRIERILDGKSVPLSEECAANICSISEDGHTITFYGSKMAQEPEVTANKHVNVTAELLWNGEPKKVTAGVDLLMEDFDIPVTGVQLDQTDITMDSDTKTVLKASVLPEDATNRKVSWSSSDPKVAAVSENGEVTAVDDGTARITVTTEDGEKTASCIITVKTKANTMYRLYNKATGEHLYTANRKERDDCIGRGWKDEGIAWNSPAGGDTAVYRLYCPLKGYEQHHYTADTNEINVLVKSGWIKEGIAWFSRSGKGIPIYRAFNPKARIPAACHHLTKDAHEYRIITTRQGWKAEGIAFYAVISE